MDGSIAQLDRRLPSNKEGKNSKCFAERRLQALSPEISPPIVPKLYRIRCAASATTISARQLASSTYGVSFPVTPVRSPANIRQCRFWLTFA